MEHVCCSTQLVGLLLSSTRLARLPPPATHAQRRNLAACLLWVTLFPDALPAAPFTLAQHLQSLAAPPWLGRDARHAQQQMSAAFEACLTLLQGRVARQRLEAAGPAAAADAHAAALRCLLLFRPAPPSVANLWWAHFSAALRGLVLLAAAPSGGGAAALHAASLRHLVRCLCCSDTAHMLVPLVLTFCQELAGSAAAAPAGTAAGGGGGRGGGKAGRGRGRKAAGRGEEGGGGGGGPSAATTKQALGIAAALLEHDPPAFIASCCELLRPEANAATQTRAEALAGGCWRVLAGRPCGCSPCPFPCPPPRLLHS